MSTIKAINIIHPSSSSTNLVLNADGTSTLYGIQTNILAGSIMWFASSTAPTGYIKANGAAVSRSAYASLFSAIGTTFGSGDGSTTFNVPDLRGQFIRGFDDGAGIDNGRTFGSGQSDAFGSHTHPYSTSGSGLAGRISPGLSQAFSGNGIGDVSFSIGNAGGTETRPKNVALLACIKF